MSRLQVFQWRLAGSGALLLLVFAVIRVFWYPGAYFGISGIQKQLWMLTGVMFVVGPVLSTLVYKPGKKGLAMDLGILAAIELAAVAVAVSILFQRQPYFAVFAVDRFVAVSRPEVVARPASFAEYGTRPGHEPRLIYAKLPEDPDVLSQLMDETLLQGMADIDRRPEFWEPYASGLAMIKSAARPLDDLLDSAAQHEVVSDWLFDKADQPQDFVFLPLCGRAGDAVIVLHADTGFPVTTLAVDPW